MIRHRIIWKLRDDLSESEKNTVRQNAKQHLEGLVGEIEGLVSMKIVIDPIVGSTGDMMLDSLFVSVDALRAYAKHPAHVYVADTYVRPYTAQRACMDYESEE